MKLNLSPSQSATFAANVTTGLAPYEAMLAALTAMRDGGHAPFTRRDVFAVLAAAGYANTSVLMNEWKALPSFPRVKSAGRGYMDYPAELGGRISADGAGAPKPQVVLTEEQRATANVVSREGINWTPEQPSTAATLYDEDAGLAQMAVAATPCFASFEAKHKSCKVCPLAGSCAKATASRFEEIARDLDNEIAATLTAIAAGLQGDALEVTAPAPEIMKTADGAEYVVRTNPFDTPCTKCGGAIPKSEEGVHVLGKGFYHIDCASDLMSA